MYGGGGREKEEKKKAISLCRDGASLLISFQLLAD